ncbi:MAG: hypothetical protein JNL32_01085 [Candidatus Kapabacteria bacterium]|nr:hypothetical protein [Candidatus Kapabacteria bacterium]
MKTLAVIMYAVPHIYLGYLHSIEVVKLLYGTYTYDGFRFLEPLFFADILFTLSLILIAFAFKLRRFTFTAAFATLLHNMVITFGIGVFPFVGLATSIATLGVMYVGIAKRIIVFRS